MKEIDKNRRNFLKIAAFGGVALVAGKVFGPKLMDMLTPKTHKDFERFDVTETNDKFSISTKDGEEIFIMDNEKD